MAEAQVYGDSYKWVLYGDDDTMFFIDNVLALLGTLDPELPYFITGQTVPCML